MLKELRGGIGMTANQDERFAMSVAGQPSYHARSRNGRIVIHGHVNPSS